LLDLLGRCVHEAQSAQAKQRDENAGSRTHDMNDTDDDERDSALRAPVEDDGKTCHGQSISDGGQTGQHRDDSGVQAHGAQVGLDLQPRQLQVLNRETPQGIRGFAGKLQHTISLVLLARLHDPKLILRPTWNSTSDFFAVQWTNNHCSTGAVLKVPSAGAVIKPTPA
jgi:hypothetical protein